VQFANQWVLHQYQVNSDKQCKEWVIFRECSLRCGFSSYGPDAFDGSSLISRLLIPLIVTNVFVCLPWLDKLYLFHVEVMFDVGKPKQGNVTEV